MPFATVPATFRPMLTQRLCRPVVCVCRCRLATQDLRKNAYVYVNEQNWFGFKKPGKKRKRPDPDCSCSADGGI